MEIISYGKQSINADDIQAVVDVLRSDMLTQGEPIPTFEKEFANFTGFKNAVAVNSGTAALHLALSGLGLKPGDEVITTANTFVATANAIIMAGGIPVFADIDPYTWNIDPEDVKFRITSRTRAILPVHFAGQVCDMEELTSLGIPIIEDACHALSASGVGQGDSACFSFHPVKHITTGEGGMVCTNNLKQDTFYRMMRDHGRMSSQMYLLGHNYRMPGINAALGLSQLKRAKEFKEKRQLVAWKYSAEFYSLDPIITPVWDEDNSWHLYVIRIKKRNEVKQLLLDKGINTQIHYMPVYKHPYYQKLGYQALPETEKYYNECLSLPIYPDLTDIQIERVIEEVVHALYQVRH